MRAQKLLLIGTHNINLDAKGRVAIPTKYRGDLVDACKGRLVLARSPQNYSLWLYPLPVWEEIQAKIIAIPSGNKGGDRYKRILFGTAEVLDMDGSGRLLVREELRRLVGLTKEVSLVGQGNKFEIWNRAVYDEHLEEVLQEDQDSSSELAL